MKKYRLSTTISPKHWSLLKKYSEKYETQQKALERALELLDSNPLVSSTLSEDDKIWLRISMDVRSTLVLMPEEQVKLWAETADMEQFQDYVNKQRPIEFAIEYYYQKPLKSLSLREVLDCIILNARIGNIADMVTCVDAGDYYEMSITHTLGLNVSKCHVMMTGSALSSYGVKFEHTFSERTVFFKVYKNNGQQNNGGGGA